jgi:HYDIN/CFA65/VesB family protein
MRAAAGQRSGIEGFSKRGKRSWGQCLGLALALLVACSIDDRNPTVGTVGSLTPDGGGGIGGTGNGGAGAFTVVPSYVDLGSVTQGFAARARLRVTNTGGSPVAAPTIAFAAGSDPDLALIQNQCAAELAPRAQCDVRVQVVPSRVGAVQGTLQVASAGAGDMVLPVTATGLQPGPLVIQPAAGQFQDFGGVQVGEAAEATFTVSNPGTTSSGALSFAFNRPEFTASPAGAGECTPGVTDLASGESCNVRVAFSPAERGSLEATLSVGSIAAGSRSLTLRGRGLVPAILGVPATVLDFGGVVPGDTGSLDFEVENRGDGALTLAGAQLSPADLGVFRIADSNCGEGVVLSAGQRCRIQLDYRPVTEGEPSAGELLLSAQGGNPSERLALQGVALTRGNLVLEAVQAGQENFGDVLVGDHALRVFRVSNPTQQPSGVLTLMGRNGFEVQPLADAGACAPGVTELANGQSCTVQVSFGPTARGAKAGALTVDSPLAGAKSLALSGRGIAVGVLQAATGSDDAVLDFGRVTTGGSANRTITVRNGGDEVLPPPTVQVTGTSPSQAAAFSSGSGCTAPLGADAECQLVLTFAPSAVVPYAASLELVSAPGAPSRILLLGEALEPGRLALAPAAGITADFGDVAVGSSAALSFTVTNPAGGGASGAVSVRTDDSQFVVQADTCASAGAAGLADGSSCTFDVSFTPTTNAATGTRLSVLAASSGETGIALTGRGRLPAALAATTTERDLGRGNLGQPSGPTNQFTWTVNNGGDLPSGVPSVSSDNTDDFDITVDTCSMMPVAGGGSCALTIAFAPNTAGDRVARIVLTDGTSGLSVPLTVTGFGVRLAAPGEVCLATSDCSEGVCTAGVCCNQECGLTCQSCATGQCLTLSGRERCGSSGGVCFGLEQCSLPEDAGCTTSAQCGGGLECKQCLSGGSQCTAPDACCGGCRAGYQCVGGTCGCPLQANGNQQIDCGAGLCALDRAGACCPGSPPADCNCDPADNLCKECLQNDQCTSGPANSVGQCGVNRTCTYPCQPGFKSCNGACIANAACCGGCGAGQNCLNGQCTIPDGSTCSPGGTVCSSGNCSVGRCCPQSCGNGCTAQGSCACPAGQDFSQGACRKRDGQSCNPALDECANGCTSWYPDADGDLFGDENAEAQSVCGRQPPAPGLIDNGDDCCDASATINPSVTTLLGFVSGSENCPATWPLNDFNCDGRGVYQDNRQSEWSGGCDNVAPDSGNDPNTPCAERGGVSTFQAELFGLGPLFDDAGNARFCGNSSIQYIHCEVIGGVCSGSAQLAPVCL